MIDTNELTALAARLEASHGGAPCMASQALKDAATALEAQAEEIAKYKQLATAAIDGAVVLRAQLAALQCKDGLPELPSPSELNGASNSVMGFTEADLKAYASQAQAMVRAKMGPLTGEQILNHEMWRQHAGHSYREKVEIVRAIERAHGITGERK